MQVPFNLMLEVTPTKMRGFMGEAIQCEWLRWAWAQLPPAPCRQ